MIHSNHALGMMILCTIKKGHVKDLQALTVVYLTYMRYAEVSSIGAASFGYLILLSSLRQRAY